MSDDTPVNFNALLELNAPGEARLVERGERHPQGWFEGADLLTADVDLADVYIGQDNKDADDCVSISVGGHHMVNSETSRAFHCTMRAFLSWDQVERLERYLKFLLETRRLEG